MELNTARNAAYISLDFNGKAEGALVEAEALVDGLHPVLVPVHPAPVPVLAPAVEVPGAARKPATLVRYVQKLRRFNKCR